MAFELKAKREQHQKVYVALTDFAKQLHSEQRAATSEEKATLEKLQGEEVSLRNEIETLELLAGVESLAKVETESRNLNVAAPVKRLEQPGDYDLALRGWIANSAGLNIDEDVRTASARAGINLNKPKFEIRQQSTVNAEGGHLKRPQDLGNIINVLKSFGGMRQAATVIPREKGNELKYPVINDTANKAGIVNELAAFTNTDLVVSEVKLNVVSLRSAVFPVSMEILQDSEFPLMTVIQNALSTRLGRAINELATSSTTFKGILNGLTADAYEFTETGLTYADLITMQGKVDAEYQQNARFMLNSTTFQEVQLMVDDVGRPLWRQDLIGGVPGTIVDKGYVINNDMPNGKIIYGDLSNYVMLEVGSPELIVLPEIYGISHNAVGVAIFHRMGGGVVDATGIKLFDRASS